MLRIDVLTIFPAMVGAAFSEGILRRAIDHKVVEIAVHDLRDFSDNRHRTVDDAPFGGGPGMVMKAEPFFRAVKALLPDGRGPGVSLVLLSPRGRVFDQALAEELTRRERIVLLCGRYEGIDERVSQGLGADEVSLGDFVLTGGEVGALAVMEAVVRLLPGALGDEDSAKEDSFSDGLLDHPHFTRPAVVDGLGVPEVLLSGDHAKVRRWRRKESLRATLRRRPDLMARASLTSEDRRLLQEIEAEERSAAPSDEQTQGGRGPAQGRTVSSEALPSNDGIQ